jgi:hypothetical protein
MMEKQSLVVWNTILTIATLVLSFPTGSTAIHLADDSGRFVESENDLSFPAKGGENGVA